jgi:nucleoside diphosphate kinase
MSDRRFGHETDWRESVLCLIGPDAIRRQLVDDILARFRAEGLHQAEWCCVRPAAAQIDALTEANIGATGQAYRYRCLDALFALGPSVALRLRAAPGRPPAELYRRMAVRKGAADPVAAAAGTIRADLGAVNAILSLLHISDSPAHAAREAQLFLSAAAGMSGWQPPQDWTGWSAAQASAYPAERRGFDAVLAGVRSRIVTALWGQLTPAGRDLAGRLARQGQQAGGDAGERIAAHLVSPAGTPLVAVLRARFEPDTRAPDIDAVARVMYAAGLDLDPWEQLVLGTSSYFRPARVAAEVREGARA